MRVALALLLASSLARADVTVGALRAPHTPLGAACDAALARAQAEFARGSDLHFHVRERTVVGEYSWSDMCGVWGEYTVTLAPDHRPAHGWRWRERRRESDTDGASVARDGSRRAAGWRARFQIRGDDAGWPAQFFVETFRPAVDACLDGAAF